MNTHNSGSPMEKEAKKVYESQDIEDTRRTSFSLPTEQDAFEITEAEASRIKHA